MRCCSAASGGERRGVAPDTAAPALLLHAGPGPRQAWPPPRRVARLWRALTHRRARLRGRARQRGGQQDLLPGRVVFIAGAKLVVDQIDHVHLGKGKRREERIRREGKQEKRGDQGSHVHLEGGKRRQRRNAGLGRECECGGGCGRSLVAMHGAGPTHAASRPHAAPPKPSMPAAAAPHAGPHLAVAGGAQPALVLVQLSGVQGRHLRRRK